MTEEELRSAIGELREGADLTVEIAATGEELRGPFKGLVDDGLLMGAGQGIAFVPADQIGLLMLQGSSRSPE